MSDINKLLEIMVRLRNPQEGCPWDIEQDFASIAPYTIEEAYEVADAIDRNAFAELRDELGDLLFQVVFHARMAEEAGHFDFSEVVEAINDKMIRRHPHVFADATVSDVAEQSQRWELAKRAEQRSDRGLLDDIAIGLPALLRAAKLGKRASSVGFDWSALAPVRNKIDEELAELDAVIDTNGAGAEEELGDLLFAAVNLARHLGVDAENALRKANLKFARRFGFIEQQLLERGVTLNDASLDQMEALWDEAKDQGL